MTGVLILRPQPGADATAERARALGLDPVVAPLFIAKAMLWTAPAGPFDATMLTSANAARLAGGGMASFLGLPCYAVGEATAAAAREAGFVEVHTGSADGAALLAGMHEDGIRTALHICGADRADLSASDIEIAHVAVYAAAVVARLPTQAETALEAGAFALLHSPRAAALFGKLADRLRARARIAAISAATAEAAGPGWASVAIADRPRDEALLELAAKLCQTAGQG